MGYRFDFNAVLSNWDYLVQGLWVTLLVTGAALLASLVVGLIVGVLRLSQNRVLSWISWPMSS